MFEQAATDDVPFGAIWSFQSLPTKFQIANQISIALLFLVMWCAVQVGLIFVSEKDTVTGTTLLSTANDYGVQLWLLYTAYRWFADGMTRYRINADEVSLKKGWMHRVQSTTPLKRVQNIEVVQGVIYRPFRLAELRVLSAGHTLKLPGLPVTVAERIRFEMMQSINGEAHVHH
jgi:membrane protein YdbS with pleckstrin-like domain